MVLFCVKNCDTKGKNQIHSFLLEVNLQCFQDEFAVKKIVRLFLFFFQKIE